MLRAHLLPAHPLAAPSAATHGPDAAMLGSEKLSLRQAAMLLAPAQGQDPATAVSAARRPELVE